MSKAKGIPVCLACALLIFGLLTSACSPVSGNKFIPVIPEGAYAIDPLFREFYDLLGGEKIMGPAISPLFPYGSRKYQYVQAGCMEYDAGAPASQRFRLSALGLDMGISEPPVAAPEKADVLYVDGHVIYSGFVSLYRKLGGARFVGKPLSEVHFNPEKNRFEQFFENLGFYWVETDSPEQVSLLAYGAWKCNTSCRYAPADNAIVDVPSIKPAAGDQIFREAVARLGSDLTGFALTEPYETKDHQIEQVYTNIVLALSPDHPDKAVLVAVPEKLGIMSDTFEEANNKEGFVFWAVDGAQGFNVPQPFVEYIMKHGGIEVSGPPISNLSLTKDQIFRQCFENLCLDYQLNSNLPMSARIRPAPLGYTYRSLHYQPTDQSNFVETQSLKSISMQVWERFQFIAASQSEEIGASVFEGDIPLKDIEPILVVMMPDGSTKSYYFPPTGEDGKTNYKLDPVDAPNGTVIPYQVCISSITKELFCVKDSFVIWYDQSRRESQKNSTAGSDPAVLFF